MRIKVSEKHRFEYVCCIPEHIKYLIVKAIKKSVEKLLLDKEEKRNAIENAKNSKVCNLEDLIHIKYI